MEKQDFINLILLEIESETKASPGTELMELSEWDSLASMVTIGLIAEKFDIIVTAPQLRDCNTFEDILKLTSYDFSR